MIIRDKPGLIDVAFAVRGTILPWIAGRLTALALICGAAIAVAHWRPALLAGINAIPFTLIGIALSIFMSFRNNACYDRWWEGRKQWGALIIAARALARLGAGLPEAERVWLHRAISAFALGLAARLRHADEAAAIAGQMGEGPWQTMPNPCDALLQAMSLRALAWKQDQANPVDAIHHGLIEGQIEALGQVQAACERIALTPLPFAYSLLLHRTATIFCVALPFALAGSLGWWTPVPVLLVGYTFFGLDALGDQMEEPFGTEPNDLPLDAMARTVEREMLGLLGHRDLPPPLEPRHGILL